MQKLNASVLFVIVVISMSVSYSANNNSYATVGMLGNNGTLCTPQNKKCGLFVSRTEMTGAGARNDNGPVGKNGVETAQIICAEEGAWVDGGTHIWQPWLSTETVPAKTLTNLDNSGAIYYRAGTALFVLDFNSLQPLNTSGTRLGASIDGTKRPIEFWTGTLPDGSFAVNDNCVNWTTRTSAYARVGYRNSILQGWTYNTRFACSQYLPVLCLQQIGSID